MHRRHRFLYAVKKMTSEVKALGREGIRYKGEGREMGNTFVLLYVHLKL